MKVLKPSRFILAVLSIILIAFIITLLVIKPLVKASTVASASQQLFTCKSLEPLDFNGANTAPGPSSTNIDNLNKDLSQNIKDYKNPFSKKDQYASNINKLAADRKDLLIKTMRQNPNEAWKKILSESDRNDLSKLTNDCAETDKTIEGKIEILHADYFSDNKSIDYYTVYTASGERFLLHAANGIKKNIMPHQEIKVKGYVLDKELLFDGQNTLSYSISTTTAVIPDAVGVQHVAVIMANFYLNPTPALTKDAVNNTMFTKVNNYYLEDSYNKTSLTGNVFGWYGINLYRNCNLQATLDAAITKADPDIDFNQYNRLIIVAPFTCNWAGMGTIDKWTVLTNEGTKIISVAWISSSFFSSQVVGHEFGHNLGVHHASSVNCGYSPIASSGCFVNEYGDPFDIMGNYSQGHMNAAHKEHLGFFNPSNIQTITSNGTYVIEPIETPSNNLKALKIPRGDNDYLFIEYRQSIGYDSLIVNPENIFQGALIHTLDTVEWANSKTWLLDMTSGIGGQQALAVGSSFTDPATGININVISQTSSALTLTITGNSTSFNPTPTFTPAPTPTTQASPTPTITPSPTVSVAPTPTPTPTLIPTPTITVIPTSTSTPTVTPTIAPTSTPTPPTTDTVPPVVSITNPVNFSTVKTGTIIPISAKATDNIGIYRVIFYSTIPYGGATTICTSTTSVNDIFTCNWNVPSIYISYLYINAIAQDYAGNSTTSTSVLVIPRWY